MDYKSRILKLHSLIAQASFDAYIVENPIDLFYLTGMEVSTGVLVADQESAFFILDGRYHETGVAQSPVPVVLLKEDTLKEVITSDLKGVKSLGFAEDITSFKRAQQLSEIVSTTPSDNLVEALREIKDKQEIEVLSEAAVLGSKGYDFVLSLLKEGITEKQVAKELEIFWMQNGGDRLAFDPIIAFGKHTSMPHYRPQPVPLKKGDPVLIDIGVVFNHYHSDMTRVHFFDGDPSAKMLEIYNVVKIAQEKALKLCKPGTTIGDLDAAARSFIKDKGYGEAFSHGLGHGVGLEIHEKPVLRNKPPYADKVLHEGMVITIEPGIYLPDIGGVRLENTVVITKEGFSDLTKRSL